MTKLISIDLADLATVNGGQEQSPMPRGIDFDHGAGAAEQQVRERAATCRALVQAGGGPGANPPAGSDQWAMQKAGRACWRSIGPS
jgi:hypothetical protein